MEKEILTHTVYPVVNDGKVIKTFMEKDDAEGYAENMNDCGARDSAREYGYEEGSPESYYQNGYDGGLYEVGRVVIPCNPQDDEAYIEKYGEDINVDMEVSETEVTLDELRSTMEKE